MEPAEDLAPQADISSPLPGDQMALLWKNDAAQYNQLKPRFNANIAWAPEHCVSKPADPQPSDTEQKKPLLDRLNPF